MPFQFGIILSYFCSVVAAVCVTFLIIVAWILYIIVTVFVTELLVLGIDLPIVSVCICPVFLFYDANLSSSILERRSGTSFNAYMMSL